MPIRQTTRASKWACTHQWQKSLDTTQRVSSLERYGANSFPNACSLSLLIAPTRMGTIEISFLPNSLSRNACSESKCSHLPFKDFADIRKMHLDAVLVFIGINRHVAELSRGTKSAYGWNSGIRRHSKPPEWESLLSRSMGRFPTGVSYSLHSESAHPSRYT